MSPNATLFAVICFGLAATTLCNAVVARDVDGSDDDDPKPIETRSGFLARLFPGFNNVPSGGDRLTGGYYPGYGASDPCHAFASSATRASGHGGYDVDVPGYADYYIACQGTLAVLHQCRHQQVYSARYGGCVPNYYN